MIQTHKKQLIISSVIILLPILAGLLLWNRLPDIVPTHWGFSGEADGWGSKTFAVFVPPLIMLGTHWLCILITAADPGNKGQNRKAQKMVLWTMPIVSLFSSAMLYGTVLDAKLNMVSITFGMTGLMFVGIGNYLPKVKQNYTIGFKVPWALHNEENWNATHRFGGKVYVIGGLALLLMAFFPTELTIGSMVIILLIMGFVPMIYSYLYYKKQCQAGNAYDVNSTPMDRTNRIITRCVIVIVVLLLIFVGILLFTGEINYIYAEDSFTVTASYWNDLTVEYSEITDIELRSGNVSGTRTWGLGNFRILAGTFSNEEFGSHTRYTCYKPEACVVVTCGEKTLVLSDENAASTQLIYDELTARLEG